MLDSGDGERELEPGLLNRHPRSLRDLSGTPGMALIYKPLLQTKWKPESKAEGIPHVGVVTLTHRGRVCGCVEVQGREPDTRCEVRVLHDLSELQWRNHL